MVHMEDQLLLHEEENQMANNCVGNRGVPLIMVEDVRRKRVGSQDEGGQALVAQNLNPPNRMTPFWKNSSRKRTIAIGQFTE
jgi:hypothetical protein